MFSTARISGNVLAALTAIGRTCTVAWPSTTQTTATMGEVIVGWVTGTTCLMAIQPVTSRMGVEIDVGGKRVRIDRIAAMPSISITEGCRIYESSTVSNSVPHWHVNRVDTLAGHKKALLTRRDPGGDSLG